MGMSYAIFKINLTLNKTVMEVNIEVLIKRGVNSLLINIIIIWISKPLQSEYA